MYLADCHTHTRCSPDSTAPLADMAAAAVSAGVSHLCVTDHCDLLGLHGGAPAPWDWAPLLEQYRAVQARCPSGLTLSLGLELGSAQFFPDRARQILSAAPVDFVIGSAHNLSPALGGEDFYFVPYPTPEACYRALDDYFASLAAIAPLDTYDALGHIIYPLRYMNGRAGHHVTLDRYQDRLAGILRAVIRAGRAIEVNTHCGAEVEPWRPILTLYRDLGGQLVTLGSDAHAPSDVAGGIPQAVQLLRACGFSHYAVYSRRQPRLIPI